MFRHCLICTDFSDGLQRLTGFVADLAAGGLQRVVFAHSVPVWEAAVYTQVLFDLISPISAP